MQSQHEPGRVSLVTAFCYLIVLASVSPVMAQGSVTTADAEQIAGLYLAAFDRPALPDGLNFWLGKFEEGQSINSISEEFVTSPEFASRYGNLNNTEFVQQLFRKVLGRDGTHSGVNFWEAKLSTGANRALVLREFADSKENRLKTSGIFSGMRLTSSGRWVYDAAIEEVVDAVRHLGAVQVNPAIRKRDAGFSARFQGRSVWVFGDTVMDYPNDDGKRMISSSMSNTYDIDAGDGIDGFTDHVDALGLPATFFALTEEEAEFNRQNATNGCAGKECSARWHIWPGTILVDEKENIAYVFYRKIMVENGFFNFHHVGHSIAVWRDVSKGPERPEFNKVESYPTLLWPKSGPGFDSAALVVGENAYLYGCKMREGSFSKPCHLARVPLADVLDRDAWVFSSGTDSWSSDVNESEPVFDGNDMMSVFFSEHLDRYVAVYSQPLASIAMLRTAKQPQGPWSEPIELLSVEAKENPLGWVYDFLAHPELSQDDGRTVYITYSENVNADHSELKLVAVDLEQFR